MTCRDEVVERVARAICATHCIAAHQVDGKCPAGCTQWSRDEATAALVALQPGAVTARDEVVERVKRVTGLDHAIINTVFWALQPGDEIGDLILVPRFQTPGPEDIRAAKAAIEASENEIARQSAENMREACLALMKNDCANYACGRQWYMEKIRSLPLPGEKGE